MAKENKTQHNKRKLLEALEQSLGVVTTACKKVGLNRTTYYEYYKKDDKFKEACDSVLNVALDYAESSLFKQMKNGVPASTIFYLKTKGRGRGYVDTQDIEIKAEIQTITRKIIKWFILNKKYFFTYSYWYYVIYYLYCIYKEANKDTKWQL